MKCASNVINVITYLIILCNTDSDNQIWVYLTVQTVRYIGRKYSFSNVLIQLTLRVGTVSCDSAPNIGINDETASIRYN